MLLFFIMALFFQTQAYSRGPIVVETWKLALPDTPMQTVTQKRIDQLSQQIPAITQTCLANIESRLQRPWPRRKDGMPKRLKIRLERDQEAFEGAAQTGGMFFIRIDMKILPFINGTTSFEKTLCHEVVHAYYRYHMNSFSYARVPRWLREGSAVYLAGQTGEKEQSFLHQHWHKRETHFNGLEGDHSFNDYFEDALAFHAMDQLRSMSGAGADEYLRLILDGIDYKQALMRLWQLNLDQFQTQALAAARDQVTTLEEKVGTVPRDYRLMQANLRTKGLNVDQPTATQLESLDLNGLMTLKEMLKSLPFKGEGERGIQLVQSLLALPQSHFFSGERANLRYLLSGLMQESGRWREALEQTTYLFNEHPESPMLQRLLPLAFAEIFFHLEDWRLVHAWGKDQKYYHSSNRQELSFYRAIADYRLGREARGREALRTLLATPDLSRRLRSQIIEYTGFHRISL